VKFNHYICKTSDVGHYRYFKHIILIIIKKREIVRKSIRQA